MGDKSRWVSGTDLILQNTRYIGIVGPLTMPPAAQIEAALAQIASAGAHTRISLVPSPARRWTTSADSASVYRLPDDLEPSVGAVLQHIRNRPGVRGPLEVSVSDRYLAIDTQHGLGDGRLFVDLAVALFALVGGGTSPWVEQPDTRMALPKALAHTFLRHPRNLVKLVRTVQDLRATPRPESVDHSGPPQPWTPSAAVELAHLSSDCEAEVERWRKADAPDCGSAAVWLYAARRAMVEVGLPMTSRVQTAFDCRRYLPKGAGANGNFATGIELVVDVERPISDVGARLRSVTTSGLPIALMGAAGAFVQLRPPVHRPNVEFSPGAPASLMFSDMGYPKPFDAFPWHADGPRYFAGLLDPSGPTGVTVLNAVVHRQRTLAISFYDNVFDRRLMRRAADMLQSDPLRLMKGA